MVGLTKRVLHKMLGRARLKFDVLKEVLLDVEVVLNNRPLGYIEEDVQLPILTPNMIIHGVGITIPDESIYDDPDINEPLTSRLAKKLRRCRDSIWCRWRDEYLRALRDRHHITKGATISPSIGDIVLIKDEEKNRGKWKLGVVTKLVQKDGVTLGAKLKTKVDTVIERVLRWK